MSAARLLALLVLLTAPWFVGEASAQVSGCTYSSPTSASCQTREQAYAAADAMTRDTSCYTSGVTWRTVQSGTSPMYVREFVVNAPGSCGQAGGRVFGVGSASWAMECPAGLSWNEATKTCQESCDAKPNGSIPALHNPGTVQCVNGCARKVYPNGDGETSSYDWTGQTCENKPEDCAQYGNASVHYVWNQYYQHCQPVEPECPAGKVVQNNQCVDKPDCPAGQFLDGQGICQNAKEECPAGQIKSPEGNCLPGDGQCAAGEVRRANGTCGKDADGDGKPDDDDDNPDNDSEKGEFSGGDSCQNPPTCNGDAILCGQARIQWRIDCNTRKSRNISGGTCDRVPMCTGEKCDAMEYSSLLMQWRTACAVEKLKNASGGTPGNEGQPDWTKVTGDGDTAGEDPDNPHKSVEMSLDGKLDHSGFFSGSGTCPQLGSFQTYFGPVNLDEVTWFCDLLAMTNYILKFVGAFIALGILMGWRFG